MRSYESFRFVIYKRELEQGATPDKANERAQRNYPVFAAGITHIDAEGMLTGEDRPLTAELEPRVAAWVETNGAALLSEARPGERHLARGGYSSVNARLRAAMRNGNL
jgi:hypothetical protein